MSRTGYAVFCAGEIYLHLFMLTDFLKGLNRIYPLSEELTGALNQNSEIIELPRQHLLLKDGQRSDYLYFVLSGLLRSYYIKDELEICSRFMHENHIVVSMAFYTRRPGNEFIETIEPSVLARIEHSKLQDIYRNHIEFNYIGRVLTEHYCSMTEQRHFLLRKQNAEERYLMFMQMYPQMMQRLPLKYIASYLGMNMETLSRVRKKVATS